MGADVGNAYLEALTNEKIYFIAGPEFAPFGLEGHTMVLYKALYGLRSSGQEWHKALSKTLKAEGFTPSLADPDVWMRKNNKLQLWEYICVYVDDLALAMENGRAFLDKLQKPIDAGGYGYKIKGDGPLTYHLGCDYYRDKDGTLAYQPKKYIDKNDGDLCQDLQH
jgi:Reverse transcriptase (RNA-dependent DNA polymerase)